MKHIIIEKCEDCPFIRVIEDPAYDSRYYFCKRTDMEIENLRNYYSIPEFCPLKDYDDD